MINYKLLNDSINFYEEIGFKRIESPWTVTKAISDITRPPEAKEFALKHEDNKVLVASGEQSFLYLYNKGFLPKGCFQTITPCFRSNSFDETHTKYFMKNELIITDYKERDEVSTLNNIVCQAKKFFSLWLNPHDINVKIINPTQWDLEYKGIELGSYGIRYCSFLNWIYGTGIAEPRFSGVLRRHGISY